MGMEHFDARTLTIGEYIVLRQITAQGDCHKDKLEELDAFSWDIFESLHRKDIIRLSKVNADTYHPHPQVHLLLSKVRHLLGISKL